MAKGQGDAAKLEGRPPAGSRAARLGGVLAAAALAAVPAAARQYSDSASMKDMTILECTGQGRWARGPMEAREIYAIDALNDDILVYDAQASSFASVCDGPGCAIGIDGGNYSASRDGGDTTYSLNISRLTGAWQEDRTTPADRTAFVKKQGVCKPRKNPIGKGPKTKF